VASTATITPAARTAADGRHLENDMVPDDGEGWGGTRGAWRDWALKAIGGPDDGIQAATEAALDVLGRGGSAEVAGVAARQAAGVEQRSDAGFLRGRLERSRVIVEELRSGTAPPQVPPEWIAAVADAFSRRAALDEAVLGGAYRRPRPAAHRIREPRRRRAAGRPAVPRPSFRAFLADRSILLLSYTGAFLLIVAAVLFILYGTTAADGPLRFAAVATVDAAFAAASWACYRSARLRLVGQSYLAIAAMLLPLTGAAAYVFLQLGTAGVSRDAAIAATGAACALLYGALGVRLRSAAYGLLGLLAAPVAWAGFLNALSVGAWWGVAFTPVAAGFALTAIAADRSPRLAAAFGRWAAWLQHAATAAALIGPLMLLPPQASLAEACRVEAAAAGSLAGIYWVAVNVRRGRVAAAMTLLLTGLAWAFGVGSIGLGGWHAVALAPLLGLLLALGARAVPLPAADQLAAVHAPFVYATAGLVAVVAFQEPAWQASAAFGALALCFGARRLLGAPRPDAWFALAALCVAWTGVLGGLQLRAWGAVPLGIAPLVAALALLDVSPRIGLAVLRPLAAPAQWFGYAASAVMALGALTVATGWSRVAALAALALVYIAVGWLTGRRRSAAIGLGAAGASWLAALTAADAGTWTSVTAAPLVAVYATVRRLAARSTRTAGFQLPAEVLTHLAAVAALAATPVALAGVRPSPGSVSAAMAALAAGYALYCVLTGRRWMSWAVGAGVTIAVVSASQALALSETAIAAALLLLAAAYAIFAAIVRSRVAAFFRVGAVVQAFAIATLALPSPAAKAGLLVAGSAVLVASACAARRPSWAYPAAILIALAWFWSATAVLPAPAHPRPGDLALVYSPLPVLYAAAGITLGRRWHVAWAMPAYAVGAAVAFAVSAGAALAGDLSLAGWSLLASATAAYVASAIERFTPGGALALAAALVSGFVLLGAAGADSRWYPLVAAGAAAVVYTGAFAWQRRSQAWAEVHAVGALAIAAAASLACFSIERFWPAGRPLALAAMLPTLALAGLLWVESRRAREPLLAYGAPVAASLAGFWVARWAGAASAHWYVLATGVALAWVGQKLALDARVRVPLVVDRILVAGGAALVLGTALAETIVATETAWAYTTLLLVEAVAAILFGIFARSRVLIVAGAAGAAAGALRAVLVLAQTMPLFVVVGVLAVALLAAGAAIALVRERLGDLRGHWRSWT
jgi:hypothetical protein